MSEAPIISLSSTDRDIMERISAGEEQAFESLFRLYYQALCLYAKKMVIDLETAEELVQDIFLKLWEKREHLELHSGIKAYLYKSVHNKCLDYLKHLQVKDKYLKEVRINHQPTVYSDAVEISELETKIFQSIESLPIKTREIFEMNRFQGLKYREIADKLQISVKTVESHMGKALKALYQDLKEFLSLIIFVLALMECQL